MYLDRIFTLKQHFGKRSEFNLETHATFTDFEKDFDRVDRERLWIVMDYMVYPAHHIKSIKSLYKETSVSLDLEFKISKKINMNRGAHHRCSLSVHLFNIHIDHIIRIWKNIIKTGVNLGNIIFNSIVFADDLCLFQESEDNLQRTMFTLANIGKDFKK